MGLTHRMELPYRFVAELAYLQLLDSKEHVQVLQQSLEHYDPMHVLLVLPNAPILQFDTHLSHLLNILDDKHLLKKSLHHIFRKYPRFHYKIHRMDFLPPSLTSTQTLNFLHEKRYSFYVYVF